MSCQFCNGSNQIKTTKFNYVGDVPARIKGTKIKLYIKKGDGYGGRYPDIFKEDYIQMVYCPICGDKLEQE